MTPVAKICALLLGGATAGSLTTIAVVERPAVVKAKPKPAKKKPVRPATPRRHAIKLPPKGAVVILDCPTPSTQTALPNEFPSLTPPESDGSQPSPGWWPPSVMPPTGGGPWIFPGVPDVSIPPIPEPTAWAMLVAGFGLVGLSMRGARHGRQDQD